MAFQFVQQFTVGGVPQAGRLVGARRRNLLPVGREGGVQHAVDVAGEDAKLLARLDVPQPRGMVVAGGEQQATALVVSDAVDDSCVLAAQHANRAGLDDVPDFDCAVPAGSGDGHAVGRKSDAGHRSVRSEDLHLRRVAQVPLPRFVAADGDEALAVGSKERGPHRAASRCKIEPGGVGSFRIGRKFRNG